MRDALGQRGWVVAAVAVAAILVAGGLGLLSRPGPGSSTSAPPASARSSPTTAAIATGTPATTRRPTPEATPTPNPLAPPDEQVLRVYCCATDPRSLRPQAASGSDEISIINATQRGLLYRDAEGNLTPSLASEMPTVSDDGLTYTYSLRDDARYSDGTTIVAQDIVRGARALADPRNSFDYGYEMCSVEGVNAVLGTDFGCSEGETPYDDPAAGTFDDQEIDGLLEQIGVEAPNDHTVVFRLFAPASFWPDITAMWLLSPVHPEQTDWDDGPTELSPEGIHASGPFMIDRWLHNSLIDLVPNPHWSGQAPTMQRIELTLGGDPVAALNEWENGDLDLVRVPSTEMSRVLATADYASMVERVNSLSIEHYDFATCQSEDVYGDLACPTNEAVTKGIVGGSPMQNVHFRRALTQAIDKQDLIDTAFNGLGEPAYSPTMPGIPGFPTVNEDNTPLPDDPSASLAQMAIALEELGVAKPIRGSVPDATLSCHETCQHTRAWVKNLDVLRIGYNCDAGHDARVMYLVGAWRQSLGFAEDQFDTRCTDFGGFPTRPPRPRFFGSVFDVARNGWGADFGHPDNQNRDLFACAAKNNGSGYCNPAYDALLNEGAESASYQESLPFYHRAEERLVEDAPALFMRYGEFVSLVRPWVINYVKSPLDQQNIGDAFYETIQIAAH